MTGPEQVAAGAAGGRERTDEELAMLGAAGIEALFARHHDALYRFCLGFTKQAEEAADVMQTVWERAFVTLSGRPGTVARVRPWLYGVARNGCLDAIRARAGEHRLDGDDVELAGGVCPERSFEQRAELTLLLDDLAGLSERQREALVMRELGGFEGDEIASALGTSPPRALGLVAEARRSMVERRSGRGMPCPMAQDELRRMRRSSRGVQAHLESCPDCQAFERARRGRSLSSLAISPLLFVVGLADRFAGLAPGAPQGIVKATAATALAVGSIGLVQPAVRPAHGPPRAAATEISAARPQRAVPAPRSTRPRAPRATPSAAGSGRPAGRSAPSTLSREAAPPARPVRPARPARVAPTAAPAPAPGRIAADAPPPAPPPPRPALTASVDEALGQTLEATRQVVGSVDAEVTATLSLLRG